MIPYVAATTSALQQVREEANIVGSSSATNETMQHLSMDFIPISDTDMSGCEVNVVATQNSIVATNDGQHISLGASNEVKYDGEVPYIGKEFNSHEDAYRYYNAYAMKMGFGIRRESMDKSRKLSTPGLIVSRTFVCSKAGRKKLSDKRQLGKLVHRRPDTRGLLTLFGMGDAQASFVLCLQ